ncbi:MAG TPA: trypsin-like peptidase domain-containing protein, partial [Thermoanaerobaculia bacterium]
MRRRPWAIALAAALLAAAAVAPAPRADEAGRRLLERYAPAVVGVEAVMRAEMRMGGESQEQEGKVELVGAVVDPGGLIMVWNSSISTSRLQEMLAATAGPNGGDFGIRMEPVSFHVVRPGSDERHAAFLAASDSQLDVAFLQLEPPPAEPLPAISFAEVGEVAVGQRLYAVTRLGASFDRAAHYAPLEVVGMLTKPRRGWILAGDQGALGQPVFDDAGRPVGVLATVISTVPRDAGLFPWSGGTFGESGRNAGPVGVFLLPGAAVGRAIELSKERARELLEERREAAEGEG